MGFHQSDAEAVRAIAAYAAEGLTRQERVLVVVTPEHRAAVDDVLRDLGLDPVQARRTGAYVTLEADHTLKAFLVDGRPDPALFVDVVGTLLAAAGEDGRPVRVFGEMVALLWDRGDVLAALELESMWNDLAQVHDFSLLCGYSTAALDGADLDHVGQVCAQHSTVLAPSSYAGASHAGADRSVALGVEEWSEVFLPVPEAVAGARRFVSSALETWGAVDLSWAATLLTSELATNAVVHGHSPFRLDVSRLMGVVRIAIEDTASAWPVQRVASSQDLDGRGMSIVRAVADRSGCDALPGGKIAWAELSVQPQGS